MGFWVSFFPRKFKIQIKKNSKSTTNPENSRSNTTYSQYKHTKKFQNQTQCAPKYKNTNP